MLKNMKIGGRLTFGFTIMLLLMLVVGGAGFWGVRTSTDKTIEIIRGDASISEHGARARANVVGLRRYEKDMYLNVTDPEKVAEYEKKWNEQLEHLNARIADLEKIVILTEEKEKLKTLKADLETYTNGFIKVRGKITAGLIKTPEDGNKAINEYKDDIHKLEAGVQNLSDEANKRMDGTEPEFRALAKRTFTILAVCIVFTIILCVILGIVITRSITTPVNNALGVANKIAEGDLTVTIESTSRDEVGQLLAAMDKMAESLRNMIGRIRSTSDQVASAANEISSGSEQMNRAAANQASAAEETSATMVQMAASIQTVAANADSLATNVDEVSSSVQELGASSEQISRSAEVMSASVIETSATIEQMTVSIDRVAQSAEELASSVSETSSTIEQMTVSIDQVAGNTQELQQVATDTAATVEQLAISIRESAKNVGSADDVAKAAAREGAAGQEAVQQALAAMERVGSVIDKTALSIANLGKRSEEIGSIVKVINEIADQTNLLALNAAIEAARAGDAGRGFAVVAEEVRKLAERSVNATKEIGEVIKQVQADTNDSVKYGELAAQEARSSMELSGAAGNALSNIVRSIEQTSNLMSEIALMTGEQANASGQVLKSVEQMTQATAQVANAAREQAQGGKQIRIAVERMNTVTQEVTGATREQAQGSRQIRIAVDNMNNVTQQVSIATKEQALSARQIVEAINSMNNMTMSVANATAEQKKGGEMVVQAVETISDSARDNLSSVEQLSSSAQGLSRQAADLAELIAQFKVY
ncbi:MAG: methyl-accepting chemotaxis protein [Geobacter sp.]|nr:MAG: methyl-accepting chemotaxis protein [Geobacter sp.]